MKDTTRSAIIAGLAVLAVAFAAATLNSTVSKENSGSRGSGGGEGGVVPPTESGSSPGEALQIPFLTEILTVLAIIALLVILAYLFLNWREAFVIVIAGIVLIVLLHLLLELLSSAGGPPDTPTMEPPRATPGGGGSSGEGSETTQPSLPSMVVLLVIGLALVGAIGALFRTQTGNKGDASSGAERSDTNAHAVGRAAGRAADRIEQEADVDNEVYRAWREMTELLDVEDPRTSTPGEFAAAAVDAGLGREDVSELTRLFEDVRYGDTPPTDEHEHHAITVFRRIEAGYAEDKSEREGTDREDES